MTRDNNARQRIACDNERANRGESGVLGPPRPSRVVPPPLTPSRPLDKRVFNWR